jgi:hypothetical protein
MRRGEALISGISLAGAIYMGAQTVHALQELPRAAMHDRPATNSFMPSIEHYEHVLELGEAAFATVALSSIPAIMARSSTVRTQ